MRVSWAKECGARADLRFTTKDTYKRFKRLQNVYVQSAKTAT